MCCYISFTDLLSLALQFFLQVLIDKAGKTLMSSSINHLSGCIFTPAAHINGL